MRLSVPRNPTRLQHIMIYCPVCQELEGCLFKADPPDPPSQIQCSACGTRWPLQLELLDHNPKIDKALSEGGIIIIPGLYED